MVTVDIGRVCDRLKKMVLSKLGNLGKTPRPIRSNMGHPASIYHSKMWALRVIT